MKELPRTTQAREVSRSVSSCRRPSGIWRHAHPACETAFSAVSGDGRSPSYPRRCRAHGQASPSEERLAAGEWPLSTQLNAAWGPAGWQPGRSWEVGTTPSLGGLLLLVRPQRDGSCARAEERLLQLGRSARRQSSMTDRFRVRRFTCYLTVKHIHRPGLTTHGRFPRPTQPEAANRAGAFPFPDHDREASERPASPLGRRPNRRSSGLAGAGEGSGGGRGSAGKQAHC